MEPCQYLVLVANFLSGLSNKWPQPCHYFVRVLHFYANLLRIYANNNIFLKRTLLIEDLSRDIKWRINISFYWYILCWTDSCNWVEFGTHSITSSFRWCMFFDRTKYCFLTMHFNKTVTNLKCFSKASHSWVSKWCPVTPQNCDPQKFLTPKISWSPKIPQ